MPHSNLQKSGKAKKKTKKINNSNKLSPSRKKKK